MERLACPTFHCSFRPNAVKDGYKSKLNLVWLSHYLWSYQALGRQVAQLEQSTPKRAIDEENRSYFLVCPGYPGVLRMMLHQIHMVQQWQLPLPICPPLQLRRSLCDLVIQSKPSLFRRPRQRNSSKYI
ncbi:hypothetical protein BS78_05G216000 [Paspalum vaginatum]|nr:hypothetical protein BS78_05G216000 [Paspalum vaginatum]